METPAELHRQLLVILEQLRRLNENPDQRTRNLSLAITHLEDCRYRLGDHIALGW